MCIRDSNEARGITTYPCPQFWHIAANEGCTAIIGLDAHNNLCLLYTSEWGYSNKVCEMARVIAAK